VAVYVLLSFDDDEHAKSFVKDIIDYHPIFNTTLSDNALPYASVRGVFKQATKFCECDNHKLGFTRGAKYGWWVCARCGYPTRAWAYWTDAWYSALGINLLPNECVKPEWRHHTYSPGHTWDFLKETL